MLSRIGVLFSSVVLYYVLSEVGVGTAQRVDHRAGRRPAASTLYESPDRLPSVGLLAWHSYKSASAECSPPETFLQQCRRPTPVCSHSCIGERPELATGTRHFRRPERLRLERSEADGAVQRAVGGPDRSTARRRCGEGPRGVSSAPAPSLFRLPSLSISCTISLHTPACELMIIRLLFATKVTFHVAFRSVS